jgi:signal transduction histidine kinase
MSGTGTAMNTESSGRPTDNAPPHNYAHSLSNLRIFLMALVAALSVFVIGTALDMMLIHEHDTRIEIVEASDALGGLVAGALSFRLLQYERERRLRLRQRIEVIADMNHHVRNALQVISFHAYTTADKEQLEAIKESMERIEWALKEVLPKL